MLIAHIGKELRRHAPFTVTGTASGMFIMAALISCNVPQSLSQVLFWAFHPLHVILSALVTTAMFRLHGGRGVWKTLFVGYVGSVGIATLSDCIIPYVGEWLLGWPDRALHLGFIEKWWLVNPLALAGIGIACRWPHTKLSHAGHVLFSTWASLFHMSMAFKQSAGPSTLLLMALFLFLAVWLPCCTSDIVFPLILSHNNLGGEQQPPTK